MRVKLINDIKDLFELQESFGHAKKYCFRGQSNATWDLVPTMFRPLVGADPPIGLDDREWIGRCERDIYREFGRHAREHTKNIQDEWELLCVAQHYGTPTRLLDWTRNLKFASYFALHNHPPHDAAVWCLNLSDFPFPQSLGRQVPKGGYRLDNIKAYAIGTEPSFFQKVSRPLIPGNTPTPDSTFIVFEIPSVVPRIARQDVLFSIYLSFDDCDLVWNHSDYMSQVECDSSLELLIKAIIPGSEANKVREQLEKDGVNLYGLFPDLVGLGKHLRHEHGLTFKTYLDRR